MGLESERRVNPRIPFDELLYSWNLPGSTKMQGANLSVGGIFVHAETQLPLGSIVELEAQFKHQASPLILKGQVVWTAKGDEPGMGLKFVGLSEEAEKTLVNYILRRQIRSSGRPTITKDVWGDV